MALEILVNTGSGNGLLPDGTKPLPEPMLTHLQWGLVAFIWGQFHKRYLSHHSLKLAWKLLKIKLKSHRGQWVKTTLLQSCSYTNGISSSNSTKWGFYIMNLQKFWHPYSNINTCSNIFIFNNWIHSTLSNYNFKKHLRLFSLKKNMGPQSPVLRSIYLK